MFKIALYIYTSVDFKKYSASRSAIVTAQYMLLLDRDGRKISKGDNFNIFQQYTSVTTLLDIDLCSLYFLFTILCFCNMERGYGV